MHRERLPPAVRTYAADVDHERIAEVMEGWRLPFELRAVLAVSAFGDVFVEGPEGIVWRVDSVGGDILRVAHGIDAFCAVAADHLDDWFRAPAFRAVVAAGPTLPSGSLFAVPLTDKQIEPNRVRVVDAWLHLQILGQMFASLPRVAEATTPELRLDREWRRREQLLVADVRRLGAIENDEVILRFDMARGLVWAGASNQGPALVCGAARAIGTFARSDDSYRPAAANASFPAHVVLPSADDDAHAVVHSTTPAEASIIALAVATRANAQHIASHCDSQHVLFEALFDLHKAGPADPPWPGVPSPWPFVLQNMTEMLAELKKGEDIRALMRNRGAAMTNDPMRRGTRWQEPLQRLGNKLVVAADHGVAVQRLALLDVRAMAERYEMP